MEAIRRAMRRTLQGARRLRSLISDDDHDTWYEKQTPDHEKPPNLMGPGMQ